MGYYVCKVYDIKWRSENRDKLPQSLDFLLPEPSDYVIKESFTEKRINKLIREFIVDLYKTKVDNYTFYIQPSGGNSTSYDNSN